MSNNSQLQFEVAKSLIQYHLSGFRGYPNTPAGEDNFARCLQDCVVSVEHAKATLLLFQETFPSKKGIIETALNIRDRFEVPPEKLAEWEAKYGPPAPAVDENGTCLCCGTPWAEIFRDAGRVRSGELHTKRRGPN